ncbi:MAG: ribulose-phosphate 3-epimerase [Chitinivibrionales bacterium]|nr:ribulose-phosphate 3-epimerase [Chitinivibrionales bacterium]MBD3395323.1 ribulose-phosphate 3-epimerase [Chitinivibrionales bacterium]
MNNRTIRIAPSILSADFGALEREIAAVLDGGADLIHCDVMDGHFVPNLTFGPLVVEAVKKCSRVPLDVHLMMTNPSKYISRFAEAGADTIIVHAEIDEPLDQLIALIRDSGARAGVTVNPDKPVDLFLPYLDAIDQVLIMTVYAGFGGQEFMADAVPKVRAVYDAAVAAGKTLDIEVDGGINGETAAVCAENGANIFVAGNFVFGSSDYAGRIRSVREGARRGAAHLAGR